MSSPPFRELRWGGGYLRADGLSTPAAGGRSPLPPFGPGRKRAAAKREDGKEEGKDIGNSMKTTERKESHPPLMTSPVAAGFPSPADPYVESPLDLNELLVQRPAATFFVRAAGDSMTGAGIRSGDILVVDRSLEAWNGAIVIACVDNEFTVKTLRSDVRSWYLQPANRKYKAITSSGERELKIFGVVTAVIHQFIHTSGKTTASGPGSE